MKSKITQRENQLILDYHNTGVLYIFPLFALILAGVIIWVLEAHFSLIKSLFIITFTLIPMLIILCSIPSRKVLILDKNQDSLTFTTQKFILTKTIQDDLKNIQSIEVNKSSGGLLEFDILTSKQKIMIYNNYNNVTSEALSHVEQLKEHQQYKHQIEDFLN